MAQKNRGEHVYYCSGEKKKNKSAEQSIISVSGKISIKKPILTSVPRYFVESPNPTVHPKDRFYRHGSATNVVSLAEPNILPVRKIAYLSAVLGAI